MQNECRLHCTDKTARGLFDPCVCLCVIAGDGASRRSIRLLVLDYLSKSHWNSDIVHTWYYTNATFEHDFRGWENLRQLETCWCCLIIFFSFFLFVILLRGIICGERGRPTIALKQIREHGVGSLQAEKTQSMVISKELIRCKLMTHKKIIQQVLKFNYLGAVISSDRNLTGNS